MKSTGSMEIDYHLLAAYLNGTASSKEQNKVEQWIQSSKENQQQFQDIRKIWQKSGGLRNDPTVDINQSWGRFVSLKEQSEAQSRRIIWRNWIGRAAAVLLLVTGFTLVIWNYRSQTSWQEVSSQSAMVSDMLLPDGTRVWLNKYSQLSYPDNFGVSQRKVHLTGEGYFEVVKDSERPFLIEAGETEIRVLGTSFNVRRSDSQTEVLVNSGTVAFYDLENSSEKVILQPQDIGIYHLTDDRLIKSRNHDPNYQSWKTGRLVFEEMTLADVLKALERHYHQRILLDNPSMAACRVNTRFDNPSLTEVLEEVCLLLGYSYQIDSDGYLIKGSGCNPEAG
ncbi:MAG: anti-sigma factor [Cyclobacteriaceae bacterium]|nr:MAG: anti-sigma factor [Cyclobacteriaceae bacterium]